MAEKAFVMFRRDTTETTGGGWVKYMVLNMVKFDLQNTEVT